MTIGTIQPDQLDGLGRITRDTGLPDDLVSILNELARREDGWSKDAADAAAADTLAEHAFAGKSQDTKVVNKVFYIPDATLTAHDTDYATLEVRERLADGSDGGLIASITTTTADSGSWAAFVAVDFNLESLAARTIAADSSLTIKIAKAASGVVVPAGRLVVEYN